MSWGFINPWFLLAGVLIVAPILIHLVARRQAAGAPFPSLLLLQRIPPQRLQRREVRDPWLLLIRCLLLLALALVFAGPWCSFQQTSTGVEQQTVVLIDRSFSMRRGETWQRAQRAALETIDGLSGDTRAAVAAFDHRLRLLTEMTGDRAALRQAANGLRAGDAAGDVTRALADAAAVFERELRSRMRIVVISDMQRIADDRQAVLPPDIELSVIDVGATVPAPVPVLREVQPAPANAQSPQLRLAVAVENVAGNAPVLLRMTMDGHETMQRALTPREVQTREVLVGVVPPTERASEMRLGFAQRPPHEGLAYAVARVAPLRVNLIGSRLAGTAYLSETMRLMREPGVRLLRIDSVAEALAGTPPDVVILAEVPRFKRDELRLLKTYVERGGGLLVFAGEDATAMAALDQSGLLPASVSAAVQAGAARIGVLDTSHPAMHALHTSQLSQGIVWHRVSLQARDATNVLARFDDGTPALVSAQSKAGKLLLVATSLVSHASSLALEPGFAPLIDNALRYLAGRGRGEGLRAVQVGEVVDVAEQATALGGVAVTRQLQAGGVILAESPSGVIHKLAGANPALLAEEAGFYRLHVPGERGAATPVAVNVPRAELGTDRVSVEDLVLSVQRTADVPGNVATREVSTEDSLFDWRILLMLALLLLLADGMLAARLSNRHRAMESVT